MRNRRHESGNRMSSYMSLFLSKVNAIKAFFLSIMSKGSVSEDASNKPKQKQNRDKPANITISHPKAGLVSAALHEGLQRANEEFNAKNSTAPKNIEPKKPVARNNKNASNQSIFPPAKKQRYSSSKKKDLIPYSDSIFGYMKFK